MLLYVLSVSHILTLLINGFNPNEWLVSQTVFPFQLLYIRLAAARTFALYYTMKSPLNMLPSFNPCDPLQITFLCKTLNKRLVKKSTAIIQESYKSNGLQIVGQISYHSTHTFIASKIIPETYRVNES